jgi:signal transduction histidine kinase
LFVEANKHTNPITQVRFDTMQIRNKSFTHKAADVFSIVNEPSAVGTPGRWLGKEVLCQLEKMDAIGQLAGGVAHEFNNILATIVLNAELLEHRLGKENERVQSLLRVAFRGSELTQKMLSFSRRQQLNPRVLDLGSLAEGMIDRLMQTLGETIKTDLIQAPDLWPVNADPIQLESAVLNLAGNARDAMPLGGRLVIEMANLRLEPKHADTQPGLVPGDYVVLAVSDTGRGIKPDVIERVFEPFFTTKDVGEGVGLGLSLVYGFARQSGGHVTIESALGRGTTVKLYLPRATGEVK